MSPYGCHNKPRPIADAPLIVQDGYHQFHNQQNVPVKVPRYVEAPYVMTTDCQYTQQHGSDAQCSGCVHKMKELT